MRILAIILLVLSAIPLIVYPAVLLAGVMSIAGETTGNPSVALVVASKLSVIGSLLYPGVFFGAVVGFVALEKMKKHKVQVFVSGIPLFYLGVVVLLFYLWFSLETG